MANDNTSNNTPKKKRGRPPKGSKHKNHSTVRIGRKFKTYKKSSGKSNTNIQECVNNGPPANTTTSNTQTGSQDNQFRTIAPKVVKEKKAIFANSCYEFEQRICIAFIYVHVMDAPPEEEWDTRFDGTISVIKNLLRIPNGSRRIIRTVLEKCKEAQENGTHVDLSRQPRTVSPQHYKIVPGSDAEDLAISLIEQGVSFNIAANMINLFLERQGIDKTVSRHCIESVQKRFEDRSIITKIRKMPQSSENHILWKEARFNWVCHLLVRSGMQVPNPDNHAWIDPNKLEAEGMCFKWEQVAFLTRYTRSNK